MKRKFLTFSLATAITLSSISPTAKVFGNDLGNNEKSNIETLIGFKYPETAESLKAKNLKAVLTGNGNEIVLDLNTLIDERVTSENIIGEITKDGNKITSIKFKIDGLKPSKSYNLTIDGDKYIKTSINLDTTHFSKRVDINTSSVFILGDVNNDETIDNNDLKILEQNLNKENSKYDLNGDGIITISDIAIVNKNMKATAKANIYDTTAIPSSIEKKVDISEMESGSKIEGAGTIQDIFKPEGELKLAPKENSDVVSLPISFNNPEEISEFSISLPYGVSEEDIKINFYDESNDQIEVPKEQPLRIRNKRSAETVVTINLGKRVPVKKITVDVKPKEDGFVVIKQVTFLKDIVDNSILEDTKVKNINATALNKSIKLSWGAVPNVTGYKINYGLNRNNLSKSLNVSSTNATIEGLDNFKEYYFEILATSGDWNGEKSEIISAIPIPKSVPKKPDFLVAKAKDSRINLSWNKAEDAEWYNVYIKTEKDPAPVLVLKNITETNTVVGGLKNGTNYKLYVKAVNKIGESPFSDYVDATPEKEIIEIPKIPTKNRMDNSNIINIEMGHPHNYDKQLYPNGFDKNWLIDGNYETTWVARAFWEPNSFAFTFEEPIDTDYVVWVPRLDDEFRHSNDHYTITAWAEGEDLNGPGKVIADKTPISLRGEKNSYFVLKFPKQENIKKIKIALGERPGPIRVNASEVAFYTYNNISDRINNLFDNPTKTEIKSDVTKEMIESLRAEVEDTEGFVYSKETLLDLLELAEKLLEKDYSALGIIKNGIQSIDSTEDIKNFDKAINDWQPLGLVAKPGEKIRIYAEIPEGENVELIATQHFEKPNAFQSNPIELVNGDNYIEIPKLGNISNNRGGSLYIRYSGKKQDEIKLHIRDGHKIPYLELKNFNELTEEKRKEIIGEYINSLIAYNPSTLGNLKENVLNSTEISLPSVLLSLPASEVLKGIGTEKTIDEQIETLYNTILAWEDLINIIYKTYGIDNHIDNGIKTRQNIRYMKMFTGAFMYAAGNHVGIGYDSVAALMQGTPLKNLPENSKNNQLFGWGIAHEIGHVMDKLGKAEITNNIYSLMAQTADGKSNILPSRLETSGIYEKAYEKVSVGGKGLPNDVFVQLAMYWQLHLAYDDADNPTKFYNELHKLYRGSELNSFEDMNKFAVASSKIAQKDLSIFFERWGVDLSEAAKAEMKKFSKEERAIYYLNDESRRQRLSGNQGNSNIQVSATASVSTNDKNEQLVNIQISTSENEENIIGYEILRNDKPVGFTTSNTFVDKIDSANNMAFTYKIKPIDILGNISPEQSAGEIRISYDNVVSSDKYTINTDTKIVNFSEPTVISGIKITPKSSSDTLPNGNFSIFGKIIDLDNLENDSSNSELSLIQNGDFSKNDTNKENTFISYFSKSANNQDDNKIWTYEVTQLKLDNIDLEKYNVEFISYPGDNIEFLDLGIGKLEEDFEDISAGSLVIMGKYRGNTATNNIIIKGKFMQETGLSNNSSLNHTERALNGSIYMLDTPDENGKITSSTKEGIFIFVPDIQKESELQGHSCATNSALPSQIKAEMYKSDPNGERLTSDTLWSNMPSFDSLPNIRLEGGN